MAFDLAAMRGFVRFLVHDPDGDVASNNDVRDYYINPAYQDWWRSFERRPRNNIFTVPLAAGDKITLATTYDGFIEHASITTLTGGEYALARDEFNRIRYLQETEGSMGPPSTWAPYFAYDNSPASVFIATYPIPDALDSYDLNIWGSAGSAPTLLAGDATACAIDPVSARYVARLAAYRLACDIRLSQPQIDAILIGLPGWARAKFNIDWRFEDKALPRERVLGWLDPPPRS